MATVVSIQCSVSAFRDHDQDSAEIKNAFVADEASWGRTSSGPRNCVEALLDACLGVDGQTAQMQDEGELLAFTQDETHMPNVHFLYITTGCPRRGPSTNTRTCALSFGRYCLHGSSGWSRTREPETARTGKRRGTRR